MTCTRDERARVKKNISDIDIRPRSVPYVRIDNINPEDVLAAHMSVYKTGFKMTAMTLGNSGDTALYLNPWN